MTIDTQPRRPPGRPPFTDEERARQAARGQRASALNDRMSAALADLDAVAAPNSGAMTLAQLTVAVRRIARVLAAVVRMRLGKLDEDPPA